MVPLLLPVMLIIGFIFFYYHGKILKASSFDSLVDVTVENKAIQNDLFRTDKETVELAIKANDTDIFELPYDDSISIVALDEEGQMTDYPQLDSSDFKKSQALKLFEERLKIEQSSENVEVNEEETTPDSKEESTDKRLPYYQVRKSENKGSFYFELQKDQIQSIRITRLKKEEKTISICSLKDPTKVQSIVKFQPIEELKEKDLGTIITPEETNNSNDISKSEEDESKKINSNLNQITIDPQDISATTPFKVDVDVGRTTGLIPFDSKKEPGFDTSPDDDIIRTFDQASYRVMLGISNIDVKYSSIRIRLDTELSNAWRKDSSGQIRQTAEISNGTIIDTGDGTKKSTRSSWLTLDKAAGQAYFTETIETFGGVNGDQLNPKFTVTIESATLQNGTIETIDQVIDGSVNPYMDDTLFISAKPYVDVKMAWTPNLLSTVEKITSSQDYPNTMVTNVAAYVQLKPLPGRADITLIKGATYPVGGIEYDINQKMLYSEDKTGGIKNKELIIGQDTKAMQAIMYDGLSGRDTWEKREFTSEFQKYKDSSKSLSRLMLAAPVGYTRATYPPDQTTPSINIGIYDTGNPIVSNEISNNTIKVKNTDYVPVSVGKNKWLLNLSKMASNAEPFSVVDMLVTFPYEYLENRPGIAASINYQLSISKIKYENTEQSVTTQINMVWDKKWPGSIRTYTAFLDKDRAGLSSHTDKSYKSSGDGRTIQGEKLFLRSSTTVVDITADSCIQYTRWNSNSFKYDESRDIINLHDGMKHVGNYYGVGKSSPNISLRSKKDIENDYTWYSTPEEATQKGNISAVKTVMTPEDPSGQGGPRSWIPLIVIGDVGCQDSEKKGNIALTNSFTLNKSGEEIISYPRSNISDYSYTKYDNNGNILSAHSPSGDYGDTLYIAPLTIRPTITTNKKTYAPSEIVSWTVDGKIESGSDLNHKVQFVITIPKETRYISGTAKDYKGNQLPDPIIEEESNGTYSLKWILDYVAEGSNYNPKVVFDTSIVSSKLDFVNNVAELNGKVVSEVWLEENESIKDTSSETFRTSTTGITVTNSGVVVVDKVVDKPYIESGNEVDPSKPSVSHPTDFTYTISFKNHSAIPMQNVRVLDVLPYIGDQRGTNYNGGYSLTNVEQIIESVQGAIWYTNNYVSADTDPNAVVLSSGWYKLDTDMSVLKDAKAIMVIYDELDQGEDMSISLTLRPINQKAGDKYINTPSLNSHLNKFVQGVPSEVQVYGRDLSGVVWYDDNLDGLIGNKTSGGAEDWAKEIPVKLYRTSLEVPSYKKELVKESLTGEKFVDASGNSLVKTDTNGKYFFENLPEGDYFVEFVIEDSVVRREVRVTKQLEGSDPTKNSKADIDTYQTPKYSQPILSEIASLGVNDAKYHVTDVNLGLIRPSTIRLFKFETGTAVDVNGDGQLSEAEKETGNPLKDAEFEVYEGNDDIPFAKEKTDDSGYLNFVKLFPGNHTLIETRAPDGYELIKSPIVITITEGNQTIKVYQEDDKKTDLPFTGGNQLLLIILLTASGAITLGFGYMLWYYCVPKKESEDK